jgi:ADP-ribose pyrophosphatase YjhB (NUDIX family)
MLAFKEDLYNGLIVDREKIDNNLSSFATNLERLIVYAKNKRNNLIWLDLLSSQSQQIALALERGFEFHNCEPHRTMLIYKINSKAYVPVSPSHTIGVGAVVINPKEELLMVRTHICNRDHSRYKLPGGMLEHADRLIDGIEREVYEETGIRSRLIKMVSLLNAHPYRYNKSNIYIVFQLEALSEEINIIDTHEIAEAIWMPLEHFFADERISGFQKDLVQQTMSCEGLKLLSGSSDRYFKDKKHVEVYG